ASGAASGMIHEAMIPVMRDFLFSQGFNTHTIAAKKEFDALMNAGSILLGSAVGSLSGGYNNAASGANIAYTADVFNRQLHDVEKLRIKELANGDAEKEARLTAAACTLIRCADGVPSDNPDYLVLKQLQDFGDTLTDEKNLLATQKGWDGRTYGNLFQYTIGMDLTDYWTQTKQGTRLFGTVQAIGGAAGIAGGMGMCTSGLGCFLGAGTTTISADYLQAGVIQAYTGNTWITEGEMVLQSLGLSPQAAAIAYGLIGLSPSAIEAWTVNKAVNAEIAANNLARLTYGTENAILHDLKIETDLLISTENTKRVATAIAGYPELGIQTKVFQNILPQDLNYKTTTFPGVRPIDSENLAIIDKQNFMQAVESAYTKGGQELNLYTKQLIYTYISSRNSFPIIAGIPGLHAEVQAMNAVFSSVKNPNLLDLSKMNIATYKLGSSNVSDVQGGAFTACTNCSGIIPSQANVITGRK
ncbi:partial Toxin subunit YenC2, partial [uncultured bacterium]